VNCRLAAKISLNSRRVFTDAERALPIIPGRPAQESAMNGNRRVEIRRREYGYYVEGPGFYVWDEDPREVSRVARDLARRVGCELPAQLLTTAPPDVKR
jgi:hypothetical protein